MVETAIRLKELTKKLHEDTISPEEALELEQLLKSSTAYQAAYKDLISPEYIQQEVRAIYKFEDRKKAVLETIQGAQAAPIKTSRFHWLSKAVSIAAVFILVAAGAVYLWYPSQKPLVKKLPGHNNARLTLSNGRVIDLDKTKPGLIAEQGASSVSKTADGKLVYKTGQSSGTIAINTLETPAGGQYPIVLEDGSKIYLNSVSKLDYPEVFAKDKRVVHFSGEGYFEIKKDSLRPFFVIINGEEIRVTGTKFTINSYADEDHAVTTLVEGGIKISDAPKDRYTATVSLTINPKSINVKPGEAVIYNHRTGFKLDKNADIEEALAFTKHQFVMNSVPVSAALRQLARWYDIQIEYEKGYNPDNIIISGTFDKNQDLPEVIKILKALGVNSRLEGSKLIVR